jgi:hypothetical protein
MATPTPAIDGTPSPETWKDILRTIKDGAFVNPHSFSTWFRSTEQVREEHGKIFVAVPSRIHRKRLSDTYAQTLQKVLSHLDKLSLQIEFILSDAAVAEENRSKVSDVRVETPAKISKLPEAMAGPILSPAAWYGLSKEYMAVMKPCTEASPNYHLASFLAAVGACLGRRVYLNRSGRLHPNLFVVLVGLSGGYRKGTAVDFGKLLAKSIDSKLGLVSGLDSREGFLEHLGEIGKRQNSGGTSAIVHLSELRSLIEKTHMEGLGGIVPLLCEAYDAPDELAIHTRKNPICIERPVVSLLAATTPVWMKGLTDKDLHGGLGNRICWVSGRPGDPIPHPVPPEQKRWRKLVGEASRAIRHWPADKSTPFTLSVEASARWSQIYTDMFKRGLADDALISILCERMQNHCLKTALIWAALDGTTVIELRHLDAAYAFTQFLYDNLWAMFRGFGLSAMAELDQEIIDEVRKAGGDGIRQRHLKKRFWRTDSETFNKRLFYLTMNDGPILSVKDGQKVLLFCADDEETPAS